MIFLYVICEGVLWLLITNQLQLYMDKPKLYLSRVYLSRAVLS